MANAGTIIFKKLPGRHLGKAEKLTASILAWTFFLSATLMFFMVFVTRYLTGPRRIVWRTSTGVCLHTYECDYEFSEPVIM